MVGEVIDRAMQVHGGEGICREFLNRLISIVARTQLIRSFFFVCRGYSSSLSLGWCANSSIRRCAFPPSPQLRCTLTDDDSFEQQGPDEVHIAQIGAQELKRAPALHAAAKAIREKEEKVRKAAGLKASHL